MKPSQLLELLGKAIPKRLPVLITGSPGVGKSEIVAEAARLAGAKLLISHPAVSDPTDVKGLPWPSREKDSAHFLPFGELAIALAAEEPLVWFLDDLGQATPAVQAAHMQLLLARRVNEHLLPDFVTFVAATNRRTDRAGVTGILEPVKSRFVTIVELQADLDEWSQWAFSHINAPEIIAFVRFRPELLSNFQPSADLTNSPLPRTWAFVAKILSMELSSAVEAAAIAGAVGDGAAAEFLAFRRLYQELPSIDGILVNPDKSPLPTKPATMYAVVTALAMRANKNNFAKICRYSIRLMEEGHGEFATLLARDCVRRDPKLTATKEFVALASGPLGVLISGNL